MKRIILYSASPESGLTIVGNTEVEMALSVQHLKERVLGQFDYLLIESISDDDFNSVVSIAKDHRDKVLVCESDGSFTPSAVRFARELALVLVNAQGLYKRLCEEDDVPLLYRQLSDDTRTIQLLLNVAQSIENGFNSDADKEYQTLKSQVESLKIDVAEHKSSLNDKEKVIQSLQIQAELSKKEFAELEQKYITAGSVEEDPVSLEDYEAICSKVAELQKECDDYRIQMTQSSQSELQTKQIQLQARNSQLEGELSVALARLKQMNITFEINEQGESQVLVNYNRMLQTVQSLTETIKNMKQQVNQSENITDAEITCNYSGEAGIVPVFGVSSAGITTVAMSLCRELEERVHVAYVDFDLNTPDGDVWFKASPRVFGRDLKNTSLNLYLNETDKCLDGKYNLAREMTRTPAGSTSYVSGFYVKINQTKLANFDLGIIFNHLSESGFKYIIVDFGRIGISSLVSGILRAVCANAYAYVCVSQLDFIHLRNLTERLVQADIPIDKANLVLNMCVDTRVSRDIKKLISSFHAHSFLMYSDALRNASLKGERKSLSRDMENRDRISLLVGDIFKGQKG